MKIEQYLSQGRTLDRRINYNLQRLQDMKNSVCSLQSLRLNPTKVQTSPDGEAPFVRALLRIAEMEERVNQEIDMLVDLRAQIEAVIQTLPEDYLRLTLRYRYLCNQSWQQVADEMHAGKTTVKRWHADALAKLHLPDDPIWI